MLAFGHSSTGVLLGVGAIVMSRHWGQPWWLVPLIFLVGIAAHYAGDFIPHGHYQVGKNHLTVKSVSLLLLDVIGFGLLFLGIALHRFGIGYDWLLVAAAMAGVQVPDLFEAAVDFNLIPNNDLAKAHRRWHYDIVHWHNPKPRIGRPITWIDIWQVAVFGLALWLLLRVPVI